MDKTRNINQETRNQNWQLINEIEAWLQEHPNAHPDAIAEMMARLRELRELSDPG